MWAWLRRLFGRTAPVVPDHIELRINAPPPPHGADMHQTEVPSARGNLRGPLPAWPVAPPRTEPAPKIERRRVAFVIDVETTGFAPNDRIVALAAIRLIGLEMPPDGHYYLVFYLRKDNHPEAEAIHGWDDWTLRFQGLFATTAVELHRIFSAAALLICHNAEFDIAMLQSEFHTAGLPPLATKVSCTMLAARGRWPGQRASLDACLARIGQPRAGQRHGAFEDAFLTMNLYRFYHGAAQPYRLHTYPAPTNYRAPPPRPAGKLPRRVRKTWRPNSQ